MWTAAACALLLSFAPTPRPPPTRSASIPQCRITAHGHCFTPKNLRARCHPATGFETGGEDESLSDEQVAAIFRQFDTSGDGFIDLGELQAALEKAGKPVSLERAEEILAQVDANNDKQISLEEFRAVFKLRLELSPATKTWT